jgi:hypothetical protein
MTELQMHLGSRIGRTRVDPWRFHTVRELNRAGVKVLTRDDLEWFQWRPRENLIVIRASDDPFFRRGTVALALAHRALGHWCNSLRQDIEARDLAARWLISEPETVWARSAVPVVGFVVAAAQLRVDPAPLRVRLGAVCPCTSNLGLFRDWSCGCGEIAA